MNLERRSAIELRAAGTKNAPRLAGHAAIFDSPSHDLGGFVEYVKRGAFARTLSDEAADPLALVAHMPHLVLGRRSAGTLRLSEDSRGLAFEIDLPPTQTAADLLASIERRDITGCSFAFTVPSAGDSWSVRGTQAVRELRDVNLHEITICASPAYPATDVAVARSMFASRFTPPPGLRNARLYLETL